MIHWLRSTQKLKHMLHVEKRDIPLVPGLTDGHAGQQLGSVQEPEHGHPDLLLPSSLVAHVLKGRQRQQGWGR